MKKLMIAAAAVVCGSVFALESANIVGYQDKSLGNNANLAIPSFAPIAAEGTDVQTLKPAGEGLGTGLIQIMTLTSGLATESTYQWVVEEEAGDYDMEAAGWFNPDEWAQAEKTFEEGDGFVVLSDLAENVGSINFSGEVVVGSTVVYLGNNANLCGNMTPVDVDVQAIAAAGEGLGTGLIQIMTLTSGLATEATYQWVVEEEAGDYDMEAAGWFNPDEWAQAEKTFAPGEGFVALSDLPADVGSITIPAAILPTK